MGEVPHEAVVDLLGALSYAQLSGFEALAADAAMTPHLRAKLARMQQQYKMELDTSAPQNFNITVNPVNDAPSLSRFGSADFIIFRTVGPESNALSGTRMPSRF